MDINDTSERIMHFKRMQQTHLKQMPNDQMNHQMLQQTHPKQKPFYVPKQQIAHQKITSSKPLSTSHQYSIPRQEDHKNLQHKSIQQIAPPRVQKPPQNHSKLTFKMICQQFEALARGGDKKSTIQSIFDNPRPNIETISMFLYHMSKTFGFTESNLLSCMIYMMRYQKNCPGFRVNSRNIHLLTLASLVVALKFSSDIPPQQTKLAQTAQISLQDLCILEWKFSTILQMKFYINPNDLTEARNEIIQRCCPNQE